VVEDLIPTIEAMVVVDTMLEEMVDGTQQGDKYMQ
jgi:hypothetical protein